VSNERKRLSMNEMWRLQERGRTVNVGIVLNATATTLAREGDVRRQLRSYASPVAAWLDL